MGVSKRISVLGWSDGNVDQVGHHCGEVIIAAIGDDLRRIKTANATLATFGSDWDCTVLSYGRASPSLFPRCQVSAYREHWGTLIRRVSAYAEAYAYVALVLDDVKDASVVDPDRMLSVMDAHGAAVISPGVRHSHHMGFMSRACLYDTRFIEVFYVIFANRAWRCFTSMFDVYDTNESIVGWGFDLCFHSACGMKMLYDNRQMTMHGRRLAKNDHEGVEAQMAHLRHHVFDRTGRRCFGPREAKPATCVS